MVIRERELPIKARGQGGLRVLGLDPLYVANEGKLVAIVLPGREARARRDARASVGRDAAIIGEVVEDPLGFVQMETAFGGRRNVDWLTGEQLPRIC